MESENSNRKEEAMKKLAGRITISTFALLALGMLVAGIAIAENKVDICHVTGTGTYILINVSVNALPAHLAHGDGLPGGLVPGVGCKIFGADCSLEDAPLFGYGVVNSDILNYGDGGWAGWSVPTGKVVLGGGFELTGGPAAASAPGAPNSIWPHYTFGTDEYGWVVQDNPDGASSPGSTVYAVYADMPCGYEIVTSPPMAFGDGGYGGWSCPAGKVVLGGGFYATDRVAVSAPGTPNSIWPHYTYGPSEYGWVVRDAQDGASNTIIVYAICADMPAGYEVAVSDPLNYSDGGYGGWSCPAGKVVTGGGFALTGLAAAVSAPGTPGSAWPHYTFGPGEYGWVVQDAVDGAASYGSTVYAICATD
jgi:hypothetical protein